MKENVHSRERNKYVGMWLRKAWCKQLLVSLLVRDVTSLQTPSFHRNDFSLVQIIFHAV